MDVLPLVTFVLIILGVAGALYLAYLLHEERKQLLHTAYQEGIGRI